MFELDTNSKDTPVNKRKILKIFLLFFLHQLFRELFRNQFQSKKESFSKEYFVMDCQITQFLINSIIETGEYTLEGIAYYTRIPYDVIYEAACGINNKFCMTSWAKIVEIYLQVKPDISQVIIDKLLEIKNNYNAAFSILINEA